MTPFFRLPHRWIRNPDERLNAGFVQDNFEAVEQGVEQSLTPIPVVAALPTTPTDGQVIYYLADSTSGVVWTLKYRAAASGSYKWEFVGGSPLKDSNGTGTSGLALTAYTTTSWTTAASVTLPLAGDYWLTGNINCYTTVGTVQECVLRVGATSGATSDIASVMTGATTGTVVAPNGTVRRTGLAAGAVPQLWIASGGGTWTIQYGRLQAIPVRVG